MSADGLPALRFIMVITIGAVYTLGGFAATVLNFSDPIRDPSFVSKRNTAAALLVCGIGGVLAFSADLWRNFGRWSDRGQGVILQVCSTSRTPPETRPLSRNGTRPPRCLCVASAASSLSPPICGGTSAAGLTEDRASFSRCAPLRWQHC